MFGKEKFKRFTSGKLRWISILAFTLAFLIPFPTTIVPEQKVRAVDTTGKPISGARFRQFWDHYSYDIHGIEFFTADENGYVVLPKRTFIAPLIYRVVRSGLAYLMLLAHGSVGTSGTVNALSDKCSSDILEYNSSKHLPNIIVIDC